MTRKFKLLAETHGYEMNDALWCDGNFKLNFYPIEKFSPKIVEGYVDVTDEEIFSE